MAFDDLPRWRRRRRWPQRLALSAAIVAVTGAASGVSGSYFVNRLTANVSKVELPGLTQPGANPTAAPADDTGPRPIENYLLVGNDTRDGADPNDADYGGIGSATKTEGLNSDTIMVLRFDPNSGHSALLSIPRDTWALIQTAKPFHDRINGAFGEGRDVLVRTVTTDLGIPINHYVEVNFAGFKTLVDAIGGVALYVPYPVRDSHTGLDIAKAGCVTLDGVQARQWVRSRYLQYQKNGKWVSDESSDYGRMSRQQDFLRRAMAKLLQRSSNPAVVSEVLKAATKALTVEQGYDMVGLTRLARRLAASSTVDTYTLPTNPKKINGKDVLEIDAVAAAPILTYFKGVTNAAPVAGVPAFGQGAAVRAGAAPVVVPVILADEPPPSTTPPNGIVPDGTQTCA
jgi:polyisoprenyl-teichoic acid--peptidoglycan teichoic acid transferase